MIRRLAALLCAAGCLWPDGAHALGRYCERVDDRCWDCADVAFGFAIPCDDDPCAPSEVCVQLDGAPECHVTTRLCCSEACTQPPGCEGAATACGGDSQHRGIILACPHSILGWLDGTRHRNLLGVDLE